jgi:hypothetical protein
MSNSCAVDPRPTLDSDDQATIDEDPSGTDEKKGPYGWNASEHLVLPEPFDETTQRKGEVP